MAGGVALGDFEVPENVRLAIEARLERLGDDVAHVLTAAALIGREFGFELLGQVLKDRIASNRLLPALEEAERSGLITSSAPGPQAHFTFAHELIRQTLVSRLSLPRRQRLHQRIAESMERLHGRNVERYAAHIAGHMYQAGSTADQEKLLRYLVLAADLSLSAAAFEDAADHLEKAHELVPEADRLQRAALILKQGLAMRGLGRTEEAVSHLRQALAAYEELGEAESAARVGWELAVALWWTRRYGEAVELCERVLVSIGAQGDTERGRLLAVFGAALGLAGRGAEGAARIAEAVALAEERQDRRLLAHVLYAKCVHHYFHLEYAKAIEAGSRGSDLLRQSGALWSLADVLAFTALSLWWRGRSSESQLVCRELKPLASRLGHTVVEVLADRPPAYLELCRRADLKRFQEFAAHDLERCRGDPQTSAPTSALPVSYALMVQGAFWQGRWEEALGQLASGMAVAGPWGVGLIQGSTLLQLCYARDRERALPLITEMEQGLPVPGESADWGAWTLVLAAAEGLAVIGEQERSARLYPLVAEALRLGCVIRCPDMRFVETVAGVAAGADGQWERAEDHFRRALQQATELPHLIEGAEIRRLHAEMLIRRDGPGDRTHARQLLADAVATYRQIGMSRHEEMAWALLTTLPDRGALPGALVRPIGGRQARTALFRREGEYWTVGYQGGLFRLKDSRGLR